MEKAKILEIDWKKHIANVEINGNKYTVPLAYFGTGLFPGLRFEKDEFEILLIGPTYQEAIGILVYKQIIEEDNQTGKK